MMDMEVASPELAVEMILEAEGSIRNSEIYEPSQRQQQPEQAN
jgi:hypothetical protein